MGKGKRLKKLKAEKNNSLEEFTKRLTANFQKEIRNSNMWDDMVEQFGEKRALELLQEMKADIKPGNDTE